MTVQEITKCISCKGELETVLNLGDNFYVVNFVKEKDETLPQAPLKLVKCKDCHLVQLKHHVDRNKLFRKFWYRSSINIQMREELLNIVDKAQKVVDLNDGDAVLDIGANDGCLLGWYPPVIMTVGVDPCKELLMEGLKAERMDVVIPEFFSKAAVEHAITHDIRFKIITAVAMFYDLDDPVHFLKDCKGLLHDEGVIVLQMNYLGSLIKDTGFDMISHEHLAYYSVSSLKIVIERAGLELQGVSLSPSNGGSMRVYITHNGFDKFGEKDHEFKLWLWTNAAMRMQEENRMQLDSTSGYFPLARDISKKMRTLRDYLKELQTKGKSIYGYGASTRGQVTLQYLFKPELWAGDIPLVAIAERDEHKYGLKMVGTWTPIVPEAEARKHASHMICLPYHFRDSILVREKEWLKGGGTLIFPLPSPEIVTSEFGAKTTKMEAIHV